MLLKSLAKDLVISSQITQLGPLVNSGRDSYPEGTEELLLQAKTGGESYGGYVSLNIVNPPKGLGQPVFKKLKSELMSAYMSVGAVVGVELAGSFEHVLMPGTQFHQNKNSSFYQGIRGGISTGENINFSIAMKPTSSILDVAKKGRHDPCILIRALPVFEAMTYLVLADQLLWSRLDNLK
jgi:chorismate synthase